MHDILRRDKATGTCPSSWQLSMLVLGLAGTDEEMLRAAVAACPHCQERLRDLEAEQRDAADAPLPAALVRARPRRRTRWLAMSGAAAVLSIMSLFLWPVHHPPATRTKGTPVPHATVLRAGQIVMQDVALDSMSGLKPGDRLRLWVPPGQGRIRVEGVEREGWTSYYDGEIPADGWLPIGIGLTEQGVSRLRFVHCDHGELPDGCREQIFGL